MFGRKAALFRCRQGAPHRFVPKSVWSGIAAPGQRIYPMATSEILDGGLETIVSLARTSQHSRTLNKQQLPIEWTRKALAPKHAATRLFITQTRWTHDIPRARPLFGCRAKVGSRVVDDVSCCAGQLNLETCRYRLTDPSNYHWKNTDGVVIWCNKTISLPQNRDRTTRSRFVHYTLPVEGRRRRNYHREAIEGDPFRLLLNTITAATDSVS